VNHEQKLNEIVNLTGEINEITDIDMLLERILTKARSFVNADAGSIYIKEDHILRFKYTQNETLQKRLSPGKKLIYSSFTVPANNRSLSGYAATTGEVLNIEDVYALPPGVPYSFNPEFDRIAGYRTQSVLTFPLKNYRGHVLGVLQLINARNAGGEVVSIEKEIEPYILHFAHNAAMTIERAQLMRSIILRMIKMAELHDPKETGAHVNRVGGYSVEIYEVWAQKRGIDPAQIEKEKDTLRMAAMLHDVGKIAISNTILKKPGKLDPDEFEVMKQHTYLGARLFSDGQSELDDASCLVAANHHEKWDGKGYPGYIDILDGRPLAGRDTGDGHAVGKKGEEIPILGRIVSVADVYDALSSKRVYKEPFEESKVLDIISQESGKSFDPEVVDAFFFAIDVIRSVASRYPDESAS